MYCLSCLANQFTRLETFHHFHRVTSDCKSFASGGTLMLCEPCGLVQKELNEQWIAEITDIYKNYEAYPQSQGEEQAVFNQNTGHCSKRSEKLVQFIHTTELVQVREGKILDYGCSNGEFLSAFSKCWPQWQLYGCELSNQYNDRLYSIPNFVDMYLPDGFLANSYDLIVLNHTLEHISLVSDILGKIRRALSERGILFIQVPDLAANPYDLLVADHLMHFTSHTLSDLLIRKGFKIVCLSTDVVSKELSIIAKADFATDSLLSNKNHSMFSLNVSPTIMVNQHLHFLEQMIRDAQQIDQKGQYVIFGSSIAATWLSSYLKNFIGFVDEDPRRIGKQHLGKPIYSIDQIPNSVPIYMALPFFMAQQISERCSYKNKRFIFPTQIEAVLV